MANPSISIPDDLLEEFDRTLLELKYHNEIDQDANRSEIVQQLMREWVDEHAEDRGESGG